MARNGGELSVKRKWWLLLVVVIVVVVCVIGVGAYLFLSGLFGPGGFFEAPVDTSGINLSSDFTTEELVPTQLVNKPLNEEKIFTFPAWGWGTHGEYNVTKTSALYDGILIEIIKADSEPEANTYIERMYDREDFFEDASGVRTRFKGPSWFTYEADDISGIYWKSRIWVFRVEAVNGEIRNQAAEEFVQELRGY